MKTAVMQNFDTIIINDYETVNTTPKGEVQLENYREINNTKYIINRCFSGLKTPAMLIEERVLETNQKFPLNQGGQMLYTEPGGSVQ